MSPIEELEALVLRSGEVILLPWPMTRLQAIRIRVHSVNSLVLKVPNYSSLAGVKVENLFSEGTCDFHMMFSEEAYRDRIKTLLRRYRVVEETENGILRLSFDDFVALRLSL